MGAKTMAVGAKRRQEERRHPKRRPGRREAPISFAPLPTRTNFQVLGAEDQREHCSIVWRGGDREPARAQLTERARHCRHGCRDRQLQYVDAKNMGLASPRKSLRPATRIAGGSSMRL